MDKFSVNFIYFKYFLKGKMVVGSVIKAETKAQQEMEQWADGKFNKPIKPVGRLSHEKRQTAYQKLKNKKN